MPVTDRVAAAAALEDAVRGFLGQRSDVAPGALSPVQQRILDDLGGNMQVAYRYGHIPAMAGRLVAGDNERVGAVALGVSGVALMLIGVPTTGTSSPWVFATFCR